MGLAILFTGQGNQTQDMFLRFNDVYTNSNLEYISDKLNIKISPKIELSRELLTQNKYAQPLIAAHGLLMYQKIIAQVTPNIIALSGYSLGEITTIGASLNLKLDEMLNITINRAKFMTTLKTSRLIYIRGLLISQIKPYLAEYNCHIAIINGIDQIIIGGYLDNLTKLMTKLEQLPNYQSHKPLDVEVASHTPLLQNAGIMYQEYLLNDTLATKHLQYKIVSGYNALNSYTTLEAINNASLQMYNTIDFNKVVNVLYEMGADNILELGQGTALQGIIKNTGLPIKTRSLDEFKSIDQIINWINKII